MFKNSLDKDFKEMYSIGNILSLIQFICILSFLDIFKKGRVKMDGSFKLPNGFFDYVGEPAELMESVSQEFIQLGKLFGFQVANLCAVGFEENFTQFGTAAIDRTYSFHDPGGRKLMLCADSLAASLRAFRNILHNNQTQSMRLMSRVSIFRNRRLKYRNWSHLVCNIFNEEIGLGPELLLTNFANDFLKKYYKDITFWIYDFELFEILFKEFHVSHEDGKHLLYLIYTKKDLGLAKEKFDNNLVDAIIDIEKLGLSSEDYKHSFNLIVSKYPFLSERLEYLSLFLNFVQNSNIPFRFKWDAYRAIEYHSGLAFCVYDNESGVLIADGGGYHCMVNSLDSSIFSCYSFACSLESIVEHVLSKDPSIKAKSELCNTANLDASMNFFIETCEFLRKLGIPVKEYWSIVSLKKFLRKLDASESYCVVGSFEESTRVVKIQNLNDKNRIVEYLIPHNSS